MAELARAQHRDQLMLRAGALAYTTLFSFVPLLTVALVMVARVQPENAEIVVRAIATVIPFSTDGVQKTLTLFAQRTAALGLVAVIFSVLVTFNAFYQIEEVINAIWGIPHRRKWQLRLFSFAMVLLSGPLLKNEATDVAGTFKVPSLRNVDLTGPYFHTGGKATLAQVVEFYDNGGDFANPTKAPAIVPLHLTADQTSSLIAFLLALTDERVRRQRAPFDHPQLLIPNGADSSGNDSVLVVPAVGAGGGDALPRFLSLNPFQF